MTSTEIMGGEQRYPDQTFCRLVLRNLYDLTILNPERLFYQQAVIVGVNLTLDEIEFPFNQRLRGHYSTHTTGNDAIADWSTRVMMSFDQPLSIKTVIRIWSTG